MDVMPWITLNYRHIDDLYSITCKRMILKYFEPINLLYSKLDYIYTISSVL